MLTWEEAVSLYNSINIVEAYQEEEGVTKASQQHHNNTTTTPQQQNNIINLPPFPKGLASPLPSLPCSRFEKQVTLSRERSLWKLHPFNRKRRTSVRPETAALHWICSWTCVVQLELYIYTCFLFYLCCTLVHQKDIFTEQ